MGDNTAIEWTDASWNPIRARNVQTGQVGWFCTHVSEGCRNCYAEGINRRLGTGLDFLPRHMASGEVELFLDEGMLMEPMRWKRPRHIFVCSMTDAFADFVPDAWLDRIMAIIALTPRHTYQLPTKRPERMADYLDADDATDRIGREMYGAAPSDRSALHWPLPNLWLGCSVEDQKTANARVVPMATVAQAGWTTFVSYEPALGLVDWMGWEFLAWMISGGESGPNARPSHPDWHREARDFCALWGIAFFFKQWGAWLPEGQFDAKGMQWAPGHDGRAHWWKPEPQVGSPLEDGHCSIRMPKKAAGRSLDSIEHNAMPELVP